MTTTRTEAEKTVDDPFDGCAAFLLMPVATFVGARVYTTLWGWVAPTLGLRAFGIGTIGTLYALFMALRFRPEMRKTDPKTRRPMLRVTFEMLWADVIALGIGYAFHTWGAV